MARPGANGPPTQDTIFPGSPLTAGRTSETISLITTEYYVNQAAVPLGVAVYVCECGAKRVDCDLHPGSAPEGWSIAPDGSVLCPRCASSNDALTPEP
jgi:hypothetical protein